MQGDEVQLLNGSMAPLLRVFFVGLRVMRSKMIGRGKMFDVRYIFKPVRG